MLPATLEYDALTELPTQVRIILSAMEAGRHSLFQRRRQKRTRFHVQGALRLFSEGANAEARTLYTRDVHSRAMGFISPTRLPLGYGGTLELPSPEGSTLSIPCTIIRCRQALDDWYEGSISFSRPQPIFNAPVG